MTAATFGAGFVAGVVVCAVVVVVSVLMVLAGWM